MFSKQVRFAFDQRADPEELEGTFKLAIMAVDSLFGPYRVTLEARYQLDRGRRIAVIDTASEVGRTLALIFGGYARREFGEAAVQMTRVEDQTQSLLAGVV